MDVDEGVVNGRSFEESEWENGCHSNQIEAHKVCKISLSASCASSISLTGPTLGLFSYRFLISVNHHSTTLYPVFYMQSCTQNMAHDVCSWPSATERVASSRVSAELSMFLNDECLVPLFIEPTTRLSPLFLVRCLCLDTKLNLNQFREQPGR